MSYRIERVGVIGAGTMGAALAAHMANAGLEAVLLDIVPRELTPEEEAKGLDLNHPAVRTRIVNQGWERCLNARPANLFSRGLADRVTLGNVEDDFDLLREADWIIEAIVERLDIKQGLMKRLEGVRRPEAIVSTNTSGIPIQQIAQGRSQAFKAHFLGTHFFNPPRYLKLLEIIPGEETKPEVVEVMREFAAERLGKGVVICKDTPNFIANRFISIVGTYTVNFALDNGYTVEEVDVLTGPIIGHPKTGTFRLMDLVGLDVMAHVGSNLYDAIPHDPQRAVLRHPKNEALVQGMVARNWLGNKTAGGFYKRVASEAGAEFWWLDPETMEYRPPSRPRFDSVDEHKGVEDAGERIRALCNADDRGGRFIWAITAFGVNYAASVIPEIADDIVSVDNANKWGFMHELGPFETWDALGVRESVARMEAEGMQVTPWVKEMLAAGNERFYQEENKTKIAAYDPLTKTYKPIPVDSRVISIDQLRAEGREVHANGSASLLDMGDGVLLLEFHSPAANALDQEILAMAEQALGELEVDEWKALVIGNQGKHFSAGANIFPMAVAAQQGEYELIEGEVRRMQNIFQRMRTFHKPIVAALFGLALGGGCEVVMAASRVVASAETYIGFVEMGVGLIPAGTGSKEMIRRVVNPVMRTAHADVLPHLQKVFEQIALAKVSESAFQAREMGILGEADRIVMNQDHLLAEAKRTALEMAGAGYVPQRPDGVWAAGRDALADLRLAIWSMRQGGYATEHDAVIANRIAHVLTGGDLSEPGWVPESYILDLEREAFIALCHESKTIERMWYMLQNKKPLRN